MKAYLERPFIEGVEYTITKDFIRIACPSTNYAGVKRHAQIENPTPLYEQIVKQAKTRGVRISYTNHYRKQITRDWGNYVAACERLGKLYDAIVEQTEIVRSRGIHYGTCDDEQLKHLQDLCHEYSAYFYRGTPISIITEINRHLADLKREMDADNSNLTKIFI